jgi:hypothetical protein
MMIIMTFSACRLAELGRMQRPPEADGEPTTIALSTIQKQNQAKRETLVIRRITESALCPVATVLAWLRRTQESPEARLFSVRSRGGELRAMATPDICPRFLRVMRAAGIPDHYTAYSLKHAVVTKLYRMGATDEQVVAYGHWAKGSLTPRKWYNIATLEEEWLGTKLLGQAMGLTESKVQESFTERYLPPTRTVRQAEERASTSEALATPLNTLPRNDEAGDEADLRERDLGAGASSPLRALPPAGAPASTPSEADPTEGTGRQLKCGDLGRSGGDL